MFGAEAIFPALLMLLGCTALAAASLGGLVFGLILLFSNRRALGLICALPSSVYLLVLLYFFAPGLKPHHEAAIPAGTIDLRRGANLKMIFDGGLRPYRLQGLESQSCVLEETSLTVILPQTAPFAFKVRDASMEVIAENEITSIDLFGKVTTVPEAADLVKQICSAWKLPATGFDDALAHLGKMPGDSEGWGTELDQDGIRANVIFRPIHYITGGMGADVTVTFRLGKYPHGMIFLTKPIQPPPGYESVSMNPPPRVVAFPELPYSFEVLKWGSAGYALIFVVGFPQVMLRAMRPKKNGKV